MTRSYFIQVSFLAIAAALLLASSQVQRPEGWSVAGQYAYWLVRILIEAGLFVAFAELLARLPALAQRKWLAVALAACVSLVPFALSVTALDLILGLPELEGAVALGGTASEALQVSEQERTRISSFLLELVYLSDNHLALCILLSAPKLFSPPVPANSRRHEELSDHGANFSFGEPVHIDQGSADPVENVETPTNGYLRHLDKPFEEELLRVEAQEHYVRLIGRTESQMVLYRFIDIVAELSEDLGMQIHRSHWVAYSAIERSLREGGRLWLVLTEGTRVPVSRKYAGKVLEHMAQRQLRKKAVC
ncbi:LytTR family DNA-binding domain-containing protein [Roseibium sp. SCP14]|uniref:LytTR family DNA-binding domain-containing protein n=1 Tax=Roseibium sp. SCP14 TaxID=3141375 RepID=UPI003337817B